MPRFNDLADLEKHLDRSLGDVSDVDGFLGLDLRSLDHSPDDEDVDTDAIPDVEIPVRRRRRKP